VENFLNEIQEKSLWS